MRRFLHPNPISLTVVIILIYFGMFLKGVHFLELMELKSYDLRLLARGVQKISGHVVLAVIDEKSLKEIGKWPWPRSKIAEMINYLSSDGAAAIGFDVGFLEPDENSNLVFLKEFEKKILESGITDEAIISFLKEAKKISDNDLVLAQSIKNSQAPVILGFFFHMDKEQLDYTPTAEYMALQISRVKTMKQKVKQKGTSLRPSCPKEI